MIGSKRVLFVGSLRARGVGRQNSPGLGDILAAEEGKAGDRSAALRARPGRWSWAAPGLSHDPEGGGRRACPGSVSGPAGAEHAWAIGQSGVSKQYRSARSRRARAFGALFGSLIRVSTSFFAQTCGGSPLRAAPRLPSPDPVPCCQLSRITPASWTPSSPDATREPSLPTRLISRTSTAL